MLTDEYNYKILKIIEANPEISQRQLAKELGVSLGKANFCLKALVNVGFIKVTNFKNNQNKLAYLYLLTPSAIEQKTNITMIFLRKKLEEYERIKVEIDELRYEASKLTSNSN